jgi:formylglycine-generating enzyme required for sulfatase activity
MTPKIKSVVFILLAFVLVMGGVLFFRSRASRASASRQHKVVEIGKGVLLNLIWVEPGEFVMGTRFGNPNESPPHPVRFSRGFWMGKFEVTQAQWQAVMGGSPSQFRGPQFPVDHVSWNDSQLFLDALNKIVPGGGFRLPTEAEWEYACRAGSDSRFECGENDRDLGRGAWFRDNSGAHKPLGWINHALHVNSILTTLGVPWRMPTWGTSPVGTKPSNAWGFHDLHGSMWEWCQDWYGDSYYKESPPVDPTGPASGKFRVLRGGSWFSIGLDCRSCNRSRYEPTERSEVTGFRVVYVPPSVAARN